ncbi:Transcriptional adapter [Thalictrum thalictroides]|uniref:Transcriptional adapter n=1 Tax=Thalictrum thalictroides TaxID=46969 RepID=A0A7J6WX19_THATH|nr:Transcriptional adapter [Thalictrum thalictroides]
MGRSRSASNRQRTRKTKNSCTAAAAASASSSKQIAEDSPASEDSKKVDGKKAFYHCNYCTKDISGKIHIKCAICPDFDLCVECFSVGAELTPHKSDHPYQIMDDLSFPLLSPDWNADAEILLLEAIEMYGLGDWDEIAEHVGTKSKAQCIEHYTSFYLNSPHFPLPDMSHVTGKNRNELQSSAKGHTENNKDLSTLGEFRPTEPLYHSGFSMVEIFYGHQDDLSFPLLSPDWNADAEILLLEAIEMYGLGDWDEIAEHVGTKSKAQCIEHYTSFYLNSPHFPLPDMSHVTGKNRNELQSSAKGHTENNKDLSTLGEFRPTEPLYHSGFRTGEPALGLSRFNWFGAGSNITAAEGKVKKASGMDQIKHGRGFPNVKDPLAVPRIGFGGKKSELSSEEGPSLLELSGYNPKRNEFDPEYDIDAEKSIANLEFKDTDTEAEHELKLRMLHIYNSRIDERKRRKDFILERNLLYPDPLAKNLSPEEKKLYNQYNVYMRFHSKEEHEKLIKDVIEEHRMRKRIEEAGCLTSAEADRYFECKRKKDTEESSLEAKGRGKVLQRVSPLNGVPDSIPLGGVKVPNTVDRRPKDSSSSNDQPAFARSIDDWDITGLPGFCLLSEAEKRLCNETKMLPSRYLKLQEVISVEIFKGKITKKSDAHHFVSDDPNIVDRVYEMLVRKGIAPP